MGRSTPAPTATTQGQGQRWWLQSGDSWGSKHRKEVGPPYWKQGDTREGDTSLGHLGFPGRKLQPASGQGELWAHRGCHPDPSGLPSP